MTANVDQALLTPPRVSLLSAAEIVPVTDRRWESGFTLQSEGCEIGYLFEVCPTPDTVKDSDGAGEVKEYFPYVVYATDKCSTFTNRDFWARARRKLVLAESTRLENELWADTAGLGNPAFNDGDAVAVGNGTNTAVEGIAILDQELGEATSGRSMIHIRPILLPLLLDTNAIRREGNVYLSPMDNIVVPGRGYPGTGPADQAVGATEWIFGSTGIVRVRHSEIVLTPPEGDDRAAVTRQWNDKAVYAERVTHAELDSCAVLAVQVTTIDVTP